MKFAARKLTTQRLDRLLRWSGLWLLKVAAWIVQVAGVSAPLERAAEYALRPKIDAVAKLVCKAVAAKAARRLGLRARGGRGGRAPRPSHFVRIIIGSRLRKLVRAKDLRAKIAAILALLQNAEKEIARFAKRVSRGLTRRRGGIPRKAFMAAAISTGFAAPDCGADTS